MGIDFALPPKGPVFGAGLAARARRPSGLEPGWYAVSVNFLRGYSHPTSDGRGGLDYAEQGCYSYFLDLEPVARAGYSIYIYHVRTKATVGNVGRHLGLRADSHAGNGASTALKITRALWGSPARRERRADHRSCGTPRERRRTALLLSSNQVAV